MSSSKPIGSPADSHDSEAPVQWTPTIEGEYEHWRWRHLYGTFVGYAVYYFVRKNIPAAMPLIEKDLHITKIDLGKFLTFHDILYGFSKFVNGILGDRSNPRYFMSIGLLGSALLNLAFGFNSAAMVLGVIWVLNAWFQGMGFPPCAKLLSHWFSAGERGRKWGIWNTSHQVGGAAILSLSGWLGMHYGWRSIFIVPAVIAIVTTAFLMERLRDTPEKMGLPAVEEYARHHGHAEPPQLTAAAPKGEVNLWERVFSNKYVWFICLANFFVYVIRFSIFNWSTTYLHEIKNYNLLQASNMTASFEIAGLFGSLLAGWLADRSSRTSVCVGYMILTALSIYAFWQTPLNHPGLDQAWLFAIGFFIYGPQFLVGVMVTDIAGKEAAGSAIGLTGFFGYLSGIVTGYGLGWMVQHHGWDPTFQMMLWCCLGATIPFALCWKKS